MKVFNMEPTAGCGCRVVEESMKVGFRREGALSCQSGALVINRLLPS